MIGKFLHVYFIIDALDECSEWEKLLGVLTEIANWKLQNLHVLVTSRRGRAIEKRLTEIASSHMNLDSDLVDEDIRRYLRTTLVNDTRFKIWLEADRQEIEDTLVKGAHGMWVIRVTNLEPKLRHLTRFLWVTHQLNELAVCDSLHALREALRSLPPTLTGTYDRILRKISRPHRGNVVKLLQWLAFSTRPLALVEIVETFTIGRAKGETILPFDSDRRPREPRMPILDICSGLIALSHHKGTHPLQLHRPPASVLEDGTLTLAHLSVKEYLISEELRTSGSSSSYYHLDKKLADSVISQECLAYLLQFDTVDGLCEQSEASISFGRYAAQFWTTHGRSDDGVIPDAVQSLAASLLSSSSVHFNNWITLFDVDNIHGLRANSLIPSHDVTQLSYGSTLLIGQLAEQVSLRMGLRENSLKSSSNVPHPLYYASLLGLGQIVDRLVSSHDCDVNLMGGKYGSALASASAGGHKEVVQILLGKGAKVNMKGGLCGSALASASAFGQEEIVQILLGKGADVDMVGGEYGSALVSALAEGHEEIAQILLKKGADVNFPSNYYGSALASASYIGNTKLVQILLEKGADVNMAGGHYDSPLASASVGGHGEIVQILLENGADVNMAGKRDSALSWASAKSKKEIVQILLENGADVNLAGGYYGSALAAAAMEDRRENMQILLDKGADVNMAGGGYGSALSFASVFGHKKTVELLLEKGADVNMAGGDYGSPLASASAEGYLEIVLILLEKGADVNMVGGKYGSALASASAQGHEDIVKILLEMEANVNCLGGGNKSPLRLASVHGRLTTARLLIDWGADVNLKHEDGHSALRCAKEKSREAIVQLLLERGADPDEIAV